MGNDPPNEPAELLPPIAEPAIPFATLQSTDQRPQADEVPFDARAYVARGPRLPPRRQLHSTSTFVLLGIVMIVGLFVPVSAWRPDTWWAKLLEPSQVFSVLPFFIGVVVLIIGIKTRGIIRGCIVAGLGASAFALLAWDLRSSNVWSSLQNATYEWRAWTSIALMLAGWCGLLVAGLGLRHRPRDPLLRVAAFLGGVASVAYLLWPPERGDTPPLMTWWWESAGPLYRPLAVSALAVVCDGSSAWCLATVAAISVVLSIANKCTRRRASIVFRVLLAAFGLTTFGAAMTDCAQHTFWLRSVPNTLVIASLAAAARRCCTIVAMAACVPLGISEFLLALAERRNHDAAQGFAVQLATPAAPVDPPSPVA